MSCGHPRFLRSVRRFAADERGVISTEWAVAVAIVVMMAVPVLAVISDGSQSSSEEIMISIQDTDSFGGAGFHPGDEDRPAEDEEELYNPGADKGVGLPDDFADGQGQDGSATSGRPQYLARFGESVRRDKPTFGSGGGTLGGGGGSSSGAAQGGGFGGGASGGGSAGGARVASMDDDVDVPKSPQRRFRMRSNGCEDESQTVDNFQDTHLVVASGR